MARFRSVLAQSPAIVIASVALVFSLGGGAGYAASALHGSQLASHGVAGHHAARISAGQAAPKPVKITFHPLTLIHGWTLFAATDGHPSYAISNGVVYLSGGMRQPSGTNTEFAFLPKAARPKHTLWIGVFSEAAGGTAFLEVTPSGALFIGGANASFFSSLAGVSFPLAS
jgi:hypothetical protein